MAKINADQKKANSIAFIIVGILVCLWQFWSWGPYKVRIGDLSVETKDFLVECRYAMKGLHGNPGFTGRTEVLRSGDTITCPRRFLGPTGIGMNVWVYHPLFAQQWVHRGQKIDTSVAVLTPIALDTELAKVFDERGLKRTVTRHMSALEYKYLPAFSYEERQLLADRYVKQIQDAIRLADIYGDTYGQKTLDSYDGLFRKKNKGN